MRRNPLPVLHRVRQIMRDEARRALAEGILVEAEATAQVAAIDQVITSEAAAACAPIDSHVVRPAYPAWLVRARAAQRDARAGLHAAAERTEVLRRDLADARAATRVVEALLARQDEVRRAQEARAEQRRLDEVAARGSVVEGEVERVTGIEPA